MRTKAPRDRQIHRASASCFSDSSSIATVHIDGRKFCKRCWTRTVHRPVVHHCLLFSCSFRKGRHSRATLCPWNQRPVTQDRAIACVFVSSKPSLCAVSSYSSSCSRRYPAATADSNSPTNKLLQYCRALAADRLCGESSPQVQASMSK